MIRLSLKSYPIDTLKVIGIGDIILQSINNKFKINCSCFVLKVLMGRLPRLPININALKLSQNMELADPMFHQPADADNILIGEDMFWDILVHEQISD